MDLPQWNGWHLIGAHPDHEPDDVGSWLLHQRGEALLLEVPESLPVADVRDGLRRIGVTLRFVTASHDHEDHLDADVWDLLKIAFPDAQVIHPSSVRGDRLLHVGGEPLWLIKAPKHSATDVVTVFRGVAMTGDIELDTFEMIQSDYDVTAEDIRACIAFASDELRQYRYLPLPV